MMWKIPSNCKKHPCIAVAFAIACEISLEEFIERLKLRGGLVLDTYHMQQCLDVAWDLGYVSFLIESEPQLIPRLDYQDTPAKIPFPEGSKNRFLNYLETKPGVLGGMVFQKGHAVAWDGKRIYDPRGHVYNLDAALHYNFNVNNFVALVKSK